MDILAKIAEQKIREAMERGEFDNLPFHGVRIVPESELGPELVPALLTALGPAGEALRLEMTSALERVRVPDGTERLARAVFALLRSERAVRAPE